MDSVWPWLAVAAAGALHGAHPASGWVLAAWRAGAGRRLWRALLPIGVGQGASVLLVAAAVPVALRSGVEFDPLLPQGVAAALLVVLAVRGLRGGEHGRTRTPAWRTGVALWSFIVGTAHGAGWMLIPALAARCAAGLPGREITASGSLVLAFAAAGVHMAAMLGTTAAMAAGARRGMALLGGGRRAGQRRLDGRVGVACSAPAARHAGHGMMGSGRGVAFRPKATSRSAA